MPTLVVENVRPDVYDRLRRRAAARQRTAPEEALQLLREALSENAGRTPACRTICPARRFRPL